MRKWVRIKIKMDGKVASSSFLKRILTTSVLLSLSWPIFAIPSYYPSSFKNDFEDIRDDSLKSAIRKILVSRHWKRAGERDVLVENCDGKEKGACYRHKIVSYRSARKILFRKLHQRRNGKGTYVRDLYCGKNFSKNAPFRANNFLSCEHTWPRSKFNKSKSWVAQESDLHHLFPVDSRANSIRSNYDFGEGGESISDCGLSRVGKKTFEPPEDHKGNVARALFYFSIRYDAPINSRQERILRSWHWKDKVDDEERARNQKIYQIQKVRNPFIDFPDMVGQISDF